MAKTIKQADLPQFKIEEVKTSELKHAEYNPRRISADKIEMLKDSIKNDPDFLRVRPIIVNTSAGRENIVIGGNMRLEAALALNWDMIPALKVCVPIEKEKEWNIKDNQNYGEWDKKKIRDMLNSMALSGQDIQKLGFNKVDIKAFGIKEEGLLKKKFDSTLKLKCPKCGYEFK